MTTSTEPGGLVVRDLTVRFGGLTAVRDLSFEAPPGKVYAIVGPNGAGKTTVFNALSGFVSAQNGTCTYGGQAMLGRSPYRIARAGVARTFQNLGLFQELSALENVVAGRIAHGRVGVLRSSMRSPAARREEREANDVALHVMSLVGIEHLRNHRVSELPYGVQKRIELAKALATLPKLLMLDEPVAGLHHDERVELVERVQAAMVELPMTLLVIEHDMNVIRRLADRVTVMSFGEAISEGTPAEVAADPVVIEAYLGSDD